MSTTITWLRGLGQNARCPIGKALQKPCRDERINSSIEYATSPALIRQWIARTAMSASVKWPVRFTRRRPNCWPASDNKSTKERGSARAAETQSPA